MEGDEVELFLADSAFLKASIMVYLVPALALMVGALMGPELFKGLISDPNLAALLAGVVFFIVTFLLTYLWASRRSHDEFYLPKVVKITSRGKKE